MHFDDDDVVDVLSIFLSWLTSVLFTLHQAYSNSRTRNTKQPTTRMLNVTACSCGDRRATIRASCCCFRPFTSSAVVWTNRLTSRHWQSSRTRCLPKHTGECLWLTFQRRNECVISSLEQLNDLVIHFHSFAAYRSPLFNVVLDGNEFR